MTFLSLADCCRKLSIDPKTFRRWVKQAQLSLAPHPTDGRSKGLSLEYLQQLATAHRRTLALCQTPPPASPAPAEPAVPQSQLLGALLVELVAVQERLSRLSHQLEQLLPPEVAGPVHPPALGDGSPVASLPAGPPAPSGKQADLAPSRPRPLARVLPLVEYGRDGHYVVICPKQGRLGFEPDSPEWFAWLESRSSFRGCRDKPAASRRIGSANACPTPSGEPIASCAITPPISASLTRLA
jgi:transposase-like protein